MESNHLNLPTVDAKQLRMMPWNSCVELKTNSIAAVGDKALVFTLYPVHCQGSPSRTTSPF